MPKCNKKKAKIFGIEVEMCFNLCQNLNCGFSESLDGATDKENFSFCFYFGNVVVQFCALNIYKEQIKKQNFYQFIFPAAFVTNLKDLQQNTLDNQLNNYTVCETATLPNIRNILNNSMYLNKYLTTTKKDMSHVVLQMLIQRKKFESCCLERQEMGRALLETPS